MTHPSPLVRLNLICLSLLAAVVCGRSGAEIFHREIVRGDIQQKLRKND